MNIIDGILKDMKDLQDKVARLEAHNHYHPMIALRAATMLTISGGVITITHGYHSIDTEGAAASDNLDTINGGVEGDVLIIRAAYSSRTVVCKNGTGNLQLAGDMSLDHADDTLTLIYDGASWLEIAGSNNA